MVEGNDSRPEDSVDPRTLVNVKHERLVVSWELVDAGTPYRRLYTRTFSDPEYRLVENPSPSTSYDSEAMHATGDWLYAVRHRECRESQRDAIEMVRRPVPRLEDADWEVVARCDRNFGYERYESVWPTALLTVEDSGEVVGIFSGHPWPDAEERDAEFYLGRLNPASGEVTLTVEVEGPWY